MNDEQRLPPNNREAEEATIGSILIDPDSMFDVSEFLTADMFYNRQCKTIYKAILLLNASSSAVDALTIAEKSTEIGEEILGGVAYIHGLASVVPTSINVVEYANIVEAYFWRREGLESAKRIARASFDLEKPHTEIGDVMSDEAVSFGSGERDKYLHDSGTVAERILKKSERAHQGEEVVVSYKTGIAAFDRFMCMIDGLLVAICGRPGSGKTTLCLNLIVALATQRHVLFVSQEMDEEQLIEKMIQILAGLTLWQIREGEIPEAKWADYYNAVELLQNNHRFSILYAENIQSIWSTGARMKAKNGEAPIIFIDYLELMVEDENKDINPASTNLKRMARRLNTPVVVVRQLSRAVESRIDKHPIMPDVRQGGEMQYDAIVGCYRDEYYNPDTTDRPNIMELGALKNKYGRMGWTNGDSYCNMERSLVCDLQPHSGINL